MAVPSFFFEIWESEINGTSSFLSSEIQKLTAPGFSRFWSSGSQKMVTAPGFLKLWESENGDSSSSGSQKMVTAPGLGAPGIRTW